MLRIYVVNCYVHRSFDTVRIIDSVALDLHLNLCAIDLLLHHSCMVNWSWWNVTFIVIEFGHSFVFQ